MRPQLKPHHRFFHSFIHIRESKKAEANRLPCPCWTLKEADQMKGMRPTTPTERDAPSWDPPSVSLALMHLLMRCRFFFWPTLCLLSVEGEGACCDSLWACCLSVFGICYMSASSINFSNKIKDVRSKNVFIYSLTYT